MLYNTFKLYKIYNFAQFDFFFSGFVLNLKCIRVNDIISKLNKTGLKRERERERENKGCVRSCFPDISQECVDIGIYCMEKHQITSY